VLLLAETRGWGSHWRPLLCGTRGFRNPTTIDPSSKVLPRAAQRSTLRVSSAGNFRAAVDIGYDTGDLKLEASI